MDTPLLMQFQVTQFQMYTVKLILWELLNFSCGNESAMRRSWWKNMA